jgi:3-mercaptopyruvate sulfurtransferase SseA
MIRRLWPSDQGGLGSARLWWVLDYGHPKAKVLNGGWNKWVKKTPGRHRGANDTSRSSACTRMNRRSA